MTTLVTAVTVTMAAVLLWAGLEKARGMSLFAAALRELGVPHAVARVAAPFVIGLEVSAALALIFRPESIATLAAVIFLAAVFAIAGMVALRQHKKIRCGCFGPYGDGLLGKNQLAGFPLWLTGVALLTLNRSARSAEGAASLFAVVALTIATLRAVKAVRAALVARGDRRSAEEMFLWLRR